MVARLVTPAGGVRVVYKEGFMCHIDIREPSIVDRKGDDIMQTIQTPKEIKTHLDKFIINQDLAKKTLAVQLYNHLKTELVGEYEIDMPRGVTLLIGNTGCGKSFMMKQIVEFSGLPYVTMDCTRISPSGYKGDNLETVFHQLIRDAESIEDAKYGIVFIDEFDKLGGIGNEDQASFKRMLQQELLGVFEGVPMKVNLGGGAFKSEAMFETKNLMIVCAGAFTGLTRKKVKDKVVGFSNKEKVEDEETPTPTHEELERFGLIPELLGRITDIIKLKALTEDDLVKILTEAEDNLLMQHRNALLYDSIFVDFTKEALKTIANQAIARGTGARALRTIISQIIADIQFDIVGKEDPTFVTINEDLTYNETKMMVLLAKNPQEDDQNDVE